MFLVFIGYRSPVFQTFSGALNMFTLITMLAFCTATKHSDIKPNTKYHSYPIETPRVSIKSAPYHLSVHESDVPAVIENLERELIFRHSNDLIIVRDFDLLQITDTIDRGRFKEYKQFEHDRSSSAFGSVKQYLGHIEYALPKIVQFTECFESFVAKTISHKIRDWFTKVIDAMMMKSYKTRILLNTVIHGAISNGDHWSKNGAI